MKPALVIAITLSVSVYFVPRCEAQDRPTSGTKNAPAQAPQPAPIPIPNQIYTQQIYNETQPTKTQPPRWYKSPEWVLVIVGCITFVVIGWQSWETRHAATVAMNSERGWLFLDDLPKPEFQPQQPDAAGVYAMTITFRNAGKTICRISELSTRFHTVQAISDLPPKPKYLSTSSGIDYLLAPGGMRMGIEVLCEDVLSAAVINELRTRKRYLCFYAKVNYLDSNKKKRMLQQCHVLYCPFGLTLAGEEEEFRIGGPKAYNKAT